MAQIVSDRYRPGRSAIQMEAAVSLQSHTLTVEDTGKQQSFELVTGRAVAAVWGTTSSVPSRTLDNDQG